MPQKRLANAIKLESPALQAGGRRFESFTAHHYICIRHTMKLRQA